MLGGVVGSSVFSAWTVRRLAVLLLAVAQLSTAPTCVNGAHARLREAAHVDLSKPLPESIHYNANPGAHVLRKAKARDVLGYAVAKGGALVASDGPSATRNIWSVTKTWIATLIGICVQKGICGS